MKGRSTSTNLVDFVSRATKVMESSLQFDVIYTDFAKAFDRVKHSILLYKLNRMGIHSSLLGWIKSYLNSRSQHVRLRGWSSRTFDVTSGVPQGSHLGPLFFILFKNDATKVFNSSLTYFLYADDLKICPAVQTVRDAAVLQRDLNELLTWCQFNQLYLNADKCSVISFNRKLTTIEFEYVIDGKALKRVEIIRDLGVLMDKKLTFNDHVSNIVAKAYLMLGFVMRICKEFKDIQALKSIYFAHVRSFLEYVSVVWHPYHDTQIDRIGSVQKRFVTQTIC